MLKKLMNRLCTKAGVLKRLTELRNAKFDHGGRNALASCSLLIWKLVDRFNYSGKYHQKQ